MLKRILPLASIVLFCSTAHAGNLSGDASLGFLATTGNSETVNLNAGLGLKYTTGNWVDTLSLSAIKSSEDGESTAERYEAQAKVAYNFTEYDYVFDKAEYKMDFFGGIRERITNTVGYGRRIINTDRQMLNLQLGAGIRYSVTQKPDMEYNTEAIGTGGLKYKLQITDTSSFLQQLRVQGGASNVYLESKTALQMRIYQNLYAEFSFTVEHNTQVPADTKNTDTYTAINLTYKFGDSS